MCGYLCYYEFQTNLVPECTLRLCVPSLVLSCTCRHMRLLTTTLLTCLPLDHHHKNLQFWKQQKEELMWLYVAHFQLVIEVTLEPWSQESVATA